MGRLTINAVMFAVEVVAGVTAGSASLQADALDIAPPRVAIENGDQKEKAPTGGGGSRAFSVPVRN